jgi:hypothetical protein
LMKKGAESGKVNSKGSIVGAVFMAD